MFKKMPVCRLMISCPSDVKTEIEIINRVVDNINDSIGFSMNIFVKTLYWSKNVMPEAGEYPQSIINKQILDKSDAIIAIFGNRIGSPTQHYESGTIEEIELMIQKGKQVFVYFSDKPVRKSEIDMEAETKIRQIGGNMQDSREKKQCLIFVRNNANDTADRIEAYAKKSGMKVVETIFNTDKKAVERLRYYIERDVIICVLVRDVVDISMELNEIKAVMTLAAEHGISINAESRGYEPALISFE